MKKLYLFDFDGTLTYQDTMFLFLKYYNPEKYFWSFMKHIPVFILVKLKLMDAELVKKSFIASILKGEREIKINRKVISFFEEFYPQIIRESALNFLETIDRNHTTCYLVTASLDIWVKPFAKKMGMILLSTEAKFIDGVYTGDFNTKNNNGEEKVKRIKAQISNEKFDKIIAFGDTSGDKPMLSFAHEGHFQFFN